MEPLTGDSAAPQSVKDPNPVMAGYGQVDRPAPSHGGFRQPANRQAGGRHHVKYLRKGRTVPVVLFPAPLGGGPSAVPFEEDSRPDAASSSGRWKKGGRRTKEGDGREWKGWSSSSSSSSPSDM
ncbi:hypothetical protein EYF80_066347 [Liparis tanakae]|uniref:Uncharacterized protein n=1 Tax=Liparis tanakae TaxID=230148 RepID=A0A4Z2E4N1_9TELE|nr:hypothetical protein EYF80_066347 [Liparis tanakae]